MSKYNIEELRVKYIGKTINWLTVIDVFMRKRTAILRCQCKCGNVRDFRYAELMYKNRMSCGCYNKSKEKGKRHSEYLLNHPEVTAAATEKKRQFYADHPEVVYEKNRKISDWYKNNPDEVARLSENKKHWISNNRDKIDKMADKISEYARRNRTNVDYTPLLKIIHPDCIDDLLSGNLTSHSIIKTKCPRCGNYAEHTLHNVFNLRSQSIKSRGNKENIPLCKECSDKNFISKFEDEISEYIISFYAGKLIKNDRAVLNGKELDIYYPEKKIAIEFNGNYWHDSNHKPVDYHINKFKECLKQDILLVSIFESHWNNFKDKIKEYLKDLFNGTNNKLSFDKYGYMNNNYPAFNCEIDLENIISDCYSINNITVYTCGYSKLVT